MEILKILVTLRFGYTYNFIRDCVVRVLEKNRIDRTHFKGSCSFGVHDAVCIFQQ